MLVEIRHTAICLPDNRSPSSDKDGGEHERKYFEPIIYGPLQLFAVHLMGTIDK